LRGWAKDDPGKVALASKLRQQTTMTTEQIARRLGRGKGHIARSAARRNRIRNRPYQMTQMHADKKLRTFPLPICVHRPGYLRARPFPFPAFLSNQYMILSGHDSADSSLSPIPEPVVKSSRKGATLTPCAQNPAKKKGPMAEPPRAKT